MKKSLVLLLLSVGVFSSVQGAQHYVDQLSKEEIIKLHKSLDQNTIKKSPKVALSTGPAMGGRDKGKRLATDTNDVKKA